MLQTWVLTVMLLGCMAVPAHAAPRSPEDLPASVYLNRDGLAELTVQSTVFGAYGAMAAANAVFADDAARLSAAALLGAGLGVAAPLIYGHQRPVTVAQAVTFNSMELFGAEWGLLLPMLWSPQDSTPWLVGGLIGGVLGLGTGMVTASSLALTPAQASAATLAQSLGTAMGGSVAMMVSESLDPSPGVALALVLPATAFSVGTLLLRDVFDVDRSRIYWTGVGSIVGEVVGLGVYKIIVANHDNGRPLGACSLVGTVAGTVIGWYLSQGLDAFKNTAEEPDASVQILRPNVLTMDGPHGPELAMGIDVLRGRL